ncbi:MAG: transposase [Gaiella sp.]
MGRPPTRIDFPGAVQHVVATGDNGARIVADDTDRAWFVERMRCASAEAGWRMQAWCLLDTHAHLLVKTPEPTLGTGMRLLLGGYSRWFNRRHGRRGQLFAERYWSRPVLTPVHHARACMYIALNPVAAGICVRPDAYPWVDVSDEAVLDVHLHSVPIAAARASFASAVDGVTEEIHRGREWRRAIAARVAGDAAHRRGRTDGDRAEPSRHVDPADKPR